MRTVLALLLAALGVRALLLVVTVRGESMRPTYADGDRLLAVRSPVLRRGQAIIFTPPDPDGLAFPDDPVYRVKRLVAVAGDPTPAWVAGAVANAPVPPGHLVVRGDNNVSDDSRRYGYVPRDQVHAVVVRRLQLTSTGSVSTP